MLEFPKTLTPSGKERFLEIKKLRTLCYLRRDIYEFIISQKDSFFDLEKFFKSKEYSLPINIGDPKEIITKAISELNSLGWETKLVFGGTGLLIYDKNNPPSISYGAEI